MPNKTTTYDWSLCVKIQIEQLGKEITYL